MTARTDLESCEARGRGYRTSAFLPPLRCRRCSPFPGLPAGINTDDSDPLGPGIGACYKVPLSGPVGTPVSGGVAIVFPDFSLSSLWNPNSRGNPRKTKEVKESGDVPPPRFFMFHPPLCPCNKKHAAPSNTKTSRIWPLKPAPKTVLPGTSHSDLVAQRSGFATLRTRTGIQGFRRCKTVLQEKSE